MADIENIPHIGDVVCAIIEKNGRFLIAQRSGGDHATSEAMFSCIQ
ncbi:MAG: hypothetical protein OQK67_06100 [Chlorobium sp.]|nr:hypothetical protein [Chlorobium sp.]